MSAMLTQILIRVIVGGIIVSIFAVLSDTLKPKSFAGLFGAAPSVALATIVLTVAKEGRNHTAIEARSMILSAVASERSLPTIWLHSAAIKNKDRRYYH